MASFFYDSWRVRLQTYVDCGTLVAVLCPSCLGEDERCAECDNGKAYAIPHGLTYDRIHDKDKIIPWLLYEPPRIARQDENGDKESGGEQ